MEPTLCLLEVTAEFFDVGDRADCTELRDRDAVWHGDWESSTIDVEDTYKQDMEQLDSLSSNTNKIEIKHQHINHIIGDPKLDVEFTSPCICFTFNHIREGRKDYNYRSPIEWESELVGFDWVKEAIPGLAEEAKDIRDQYEGRKLPSGVSVKLDLDRPLKMVSWIEAIGYYAHHCEYTGEYDAYIVFNGRVRLSDIDSKILNAKNDK